MQRLVDVSEEDNDKVTETTTKKNERPTFKIKINKHHQQRSGR